MGLELAMLVYVIVFVYLIVALGEIVPVIFNNYAFMYFLVAGVAAKGRHQMYSPGWEWKS